MDTKDWEMLAAIGTHDSITQAALSLYTSQPALTKRLKLLEKEFHTQIVFRNSKGIQLTASGEHLVRYAQEMLNRLQLLNEEIACLNSGSKPLCIGIPLMFSQLVMPSILREFYAEHPEISLSTQSGFSTDISRWLINHTVDIAFIRGEFTESGYSSYSVSADPFCLINCKQIDLTQLPTLPRIVYKTDAKLQALLNQWWEKSFPGVDMSVSMEVGDSQTCIHMVEQGVGYALVPLYVINEDAKNRLWISTLLDNNGSPLLRQTLLVYPQDYMSPAAQCFVSFIKKRFSRRIARNPKI